MQVEKLKVLARPLRVLDLFAGIGGFSLGLLRASGFETTKFCEINPYCQEVLKKNFPGIPIHDDIKTLHAEKGEFDVITGGFPCQDISAAGTGQGLSGSRSGLWYEIERLIHECQPQFVLLENSPMLRQRGLSTILQQLDAVGYDAEWHCIPAARLGAQHIRDRVWVIAYASSPGLPLRGHQGENHCEGPKDQILRPSHLDAVAWDQPSDSSFVGRDVHGIPSRMDRIAALGNSLIPQIPEAIGKALLTAFHPELMVPT